MSDRSNMVLIEVNDFEKPIVFGYLIHNGIPFSGVTKNQIQLHEDHVSVMKGCVPFRVIKQQKEKKN